MRLSFVEVDSLDGNGNGYDAGQNPSPPKTTLALSLDVFDLEPGAPENTLGAQAGNRSSYLLEMRLRCCSLQRGSG